MQRSQKLLLTQEYYNIFIRKIQGGRHKKVRLSDCVRSLAEGDEPKSRENTGYREILYKIMYSQ